eukprot:m.483572 g.483572  ORF g.483572 m.483572 type:complete len:396 (-) comp22984_c0_seq1:55-1242(-)
MKSPRTFVFNPSCVLGLAKHLRVGCTLLGKAFRLFLFDKGKLSGGFLIVGIDVQAFLQVLSLELRVGLGLCSSKVRLDLGGSGHVFQRQNRCRVGNDKICRHGLELEAAGSTVEQRGDLCLDNLLVVLVSSPHCIQVASSLGVLANGFGKVLGLVILIALVLELCCNDGGLVSRQWHLTQIIRKRGIRVIGSGVRVWLAGLEFAAVGNGHGLACSSLRAPLCFHQFHKPQTFDDFTKHNVLPIQMWCRHGRDEKLRPVCSGTRVGHRQQAGFGVLDLKVFIVKLFPVNRFAPRPVLRRKVTTLAHETGDDTVKGAALVVQRLARCARPLFAGAQGAKVFSSLWDDIGVELEDNAALKLAADRDVEEHTGAFVSHVGCGCGGVKQRGRNTATLLCR